MVPVRRLWVVVGVMGAVVIVLVTIVFLGPVLRKSVGNSTNSIGGTAAPTGLKVAADGQYTTGLRLQWTWSKKVDRYQLQTSTGSSFKGATLTSLARASSAASGGTQAVTIKQLRTGTWYYVRVRAVTGKASSRWSAAVKASTAVAWPDPITAVTGKPGPKAGQLTISWTSKGLNATGYRIDTGLTIFSRTDPALPQKGRQAASFYVGPTRRTLTLSHDQLMTAGAPLGSANHLYFRVYAVTEGNAGSRERAFPNLRSSAVMGEPPEPGLSLRIGSFNVRTAGAGDAAPHDWPNRAPYVAKEILARRPGILSLQELSPGPEDGRSSPTRQTDSLLQQLDADGGGRYNLVRRTSYVRGGTVTGSQGMRILYDTSRFTLLTECPEATAVDNKKLGYNDACSFTLPLRGDDPESYRRRAAFAHFEDKGTGTRFWFVAAHLDHRIGTTLTETQSYETLRGRQIDTITSTMNTKNTDGGAIIFAGDINSYQNTPTNYAPHNNLIAAGYYDTAAAVNRINFPYPTVNNFQTKVTASSSGFGARLDVIMVKGAKGASRFENVLQPTNPRRPSDHNLIIADFTIPKQ